MTQTNATSAPSANLPVSPLLPSGPSASQSNAVSAGSLQLLGFEVPSPKDTLTVTGLLLAFLIGFFTLIGRERKSPYLTNGLFKILLFSVPAVILSLLAQMFGAPTGLQGLLSKILAAAASIFLVVALALTFWRVYKLYMRFSLFVDSANPKHIGLVRLIKHSIRRFSYKKVWEWSAIPLSPELKNNIKKILKHPQNDDGKESNDPLTSAAVSVARHGRANRILAELSTAFLQDGKSVQYMTASRHPFEFVKYLQNYIDKNTRLNWQEVQGKIVVADAYTKHFGYADSIYMNATTALKRDLGVTHVVAGDSFAGLHSASSLAFNKLKETAPKDVGRQPMLVIYEDCYALADLESREQYRIFVRHVVPSERMWQAMFTVFIETAQEKSDWDLLASYCDLTLVEKDESPK